MNVAETALPGVLLFETARHEDERGWFRELWNGARYDAAGLAARFVQTNVSSSRYGVLRGMHFQAPGAQGKLVAVLAGEIFDVAVDIRPGSPYCGQWYGTTLSAENGRQLWVPEGFAHGFLTLSAEAVVHYGCTAPYDAAADRALAWDDPEVRISWPMEPKSISPRDRAAPRLSQLRPVLEQLYGAGGIAGDRRPGSVEPARSPMPMAGRPV